MTIQKFFAVMVVVGLLVLGGGMAWAGDMEIADVNFPGEKVVAGKTLQLKDRKSVV